MLSVDDFAGFFEAVHGVQPFPWQRRLARQVIERGRWPTVLDLPTGVGKTAAMDIALFHLALEFERGGTRCAPMRIAFVVDRRLVVDDAFTRARKLACELAASSNAVVARVASALRTHLDEAAPPLVVRALRGGIPRENDWAQTPAQPTILCSTVDQVGSRLLFRGYGVSDSMKPVHAGLLGADCLILLDEAHLAEPFRQTLGWIERYRGRSWRQVDDARPWGVALLTATPGPEADAEETFTLDADDLADPILRRRLDAPKPAHLVRVTRGRTKAGPSDGTGGNDADGAELEMAGRVNALLAETASSLKHFSDPGNGASNPAIGVVVNRVARARAVFERLKAERKEAEVVLLIGPARPVDRDEAVRALAAIRTGADRSLERPLVIVATQCIEAGVDLDLDGLVTEAAPLDALRQRFGRLNRDGRPITPYAAILAARPELSARYEDPIYGKTIMATWDGLDAAATAVDARKVIDFGLRAFAMPFQAEMLSPREDAPVLLPGYVDLLSQTSPIPAADPEVGFFLHGMDREPDAVTVTWRRDIDGFEAPGDVRRLLTLASPRAAEAINLPVWAVRAWLRAKDSPLLNDLGDATTLAPDEGAARRGTEERVFRWRGGDDERSQWISPDEICPGDTVVVPARLGGVDRYGWNPQLRERASDVGAEAARPFAGRRFVVRVAPGLIDESQHDALSSTLAGAETKRWNEVRDELLRLDLEPELREDLVRLDQAGRRPVVSYLDAYPRDVDGRIRGAIFVAPLGLADGGTGEPAVAATEDDVTGSLTGFPINLAEHCKHVSEMAAEFAVAVGLPEARQRDVEIAGSLHDLGKADPRFQAWLHHGDPLGPNPTESSSVLAKSGRDIPLNARTAAGLPVRWRHEAFSVRLAPYVPAFARANDPELVLWLIGSHHGHGRALFPHEDPADATMRPLPPVLNLPSELPPGPGPQSLAYAWDGADWPALYDRVRRRYGTWELALMEAVLRLADHRASEAEASRRQ